MTKEFWIDAPPELVFPYLVQPDLATAWNGRRIVERPASRRRLPAQLAYDALN